MKKILLSSLIAAAAAVPAFAGVDNINYQAVIKDGNAVVADQKVALKFELLDNSEKVVYSEEQNATTNASGYVACQLGGDELSTIEWGDLTLRVSIDLGSGYEVLSNEAVSSVPTALYALRSADSDNLREEIDAFAGMVEYRIDKLQSQVETLDSDVIPEIEGLVQDNENTKETLRGVNAQLAGFEGFIEEVEAFNDRLSETLEPMMGLNYEEINDFHERVSNELIRINEVLDEMGGNEMDAYIKQLNNLKAELEAKLETISDYAATVEKVNELEGQVENLNMVSAVVRENESAIEELQGDFKNLGENLDNFGNEMNAKFDEVNGQLENLNNVAAVVRANEEEIEGIKASSEQMASMLEAQIEKTNNNLGVIDETVEGLVKENEETQATLRNMSADVAQIEGLAQTVEYLEESVKAIIDPTGEEPSMIMQISESLAKIGAALNQTRVELGLKEIDFAEE